MISTNNVMVIITGNYGAYAHNDSKSFLTMGKILIMMVIVPISYGNGIIVMITILMWIVRIITWE